MHEYLIGKSGTGKSTFLQHLVLQNEGGFALLDPHGDLAEAIADTMECIYFDASELQLGFDVLQNVPEAKRPLVALQAAALDSVSPAICVNPDNPQCNYTREMEPDQDRGWCEECRSNTMKSALVLAGVI
jgi:hypothetical protein